MPDQPTSTPIVELTRVSRVYGSFAALREISLTLPSGSSVLLVGENGAGKSTLLRIIAGLTAPSFGSVAVFGHHPLEARDRLAYMGHAPMLYDELTGLENLRYFANLYCLGAPHSPEQALRDVGLDPALPRRVGEYSQGMRQRASLARVLLTAPDLLLLDEPFSNLDAASVRSMIERLHRYLGSRSADGTPRTLIMTTHQQELARPLAKTLLTLRNGRFIDQ